MSRDATAADVLAGRARWSLTLGDGLALVRSLGPGSIDHVVGDPPYDAKTHNGARSLRGGGSDVKIDFDPLLAGVRRDEDNPTEAILVPACEVFVQDLLRVTRRWVLQFTTQEMARDYQVASGDEKFWRAKSGTENYIRAQWWVRTNGAPQISGDRPAVPGETIVTMHSHLYEKKRWSGGGDRGHYIGPICHPAERLGHPTQKPEWLMNVLIRKHTDPRETILDWCAGSGTTGAETLRLGRRFIGAELRGPCEQCGGDFPHDWEADLWHRVRSLDTNLRPCRHGRVNYFGIARARLESVERSLKQQTLIAV